MTSITPALSNPTLHYRPDPGEPAFRTNARASDSAFVVMAQERRNLNRMKWEALERGHEIAYADVSYAIRRVGSFWAVRAGHSEVLSRPADSRNAIKIILSEQLSERPEEIGESESTAKTRRTDEAEKTEKTGQNQGTDDAEKIEQLRDEAAALKRKLQKLQAEAEAAETPEDLEAAQQEAARVESKLAEVERELAKLENEERRRQMEKPEDVITGALQENRALVGKLVGLRYQTPPIETESGFSLLA